MGFSTYDQVFISFTPMCADDFFSFPYLSSSFLRISTEMCTPFLFLTDSDDFLQLFAKLFFCMSRPTIAMKMPSLDLAVHLIFANYAYFHKTGSKQIFEAYYNHF